jgi:hypothetical protein
MVVEYFVPFERQPIRSTFEFYKPGDSWIIYGSSYSDDLDDWVKERAKLKYMQTD